MKPTWNVWRPRKHGPRWFSELPCGHDLNGFKKWYHGKPCGTMEISRKNLWTQDLKKEMWRRFPCEYHGNPWHCQSPPWSRVSNIHWASGPMSYGPINLRSTHRNYAATACLVLKRSGRGRNWSTSCAKVHRFPRVHFPSSADAPGYPAYPRINKHNTCTIRT